MDAVITAGGRISGGFARRAGVTVKALIEIDGRPVIHAVIEALRGVAGVERILVVGPRELDEAGVGSLADEIIPEAAGGAQNFITGLDRCRSSGARAVFAASDLPFITAEAVTRYLDLCPPDADFCYPILTREQFLAAYPGASILYAALKEGRFTGGCVFALRPAAVLANRELVERVFRARKSLLWLASILGWSFIFKLLTHRADIAACARRGSEIIGCDCRAVPDSPPELAFDLDDLRDYEFALAHAGGLSG